MMLSEFLRAHFANGSTLARDRIGLGQRMPEGYAIMQTPDGKLYWLNYVGDACEPIETNDARKIRRMAIQHREGKIKSGMERPQR